MYYIRELNEAAVNMLWSLSMLLKHILIQKKKKKKNTPILARQRKKDFRLCIQQWKEEKGLSDKQRNENNTNSPLFV